MVKLAGVAAILCGAILVYREIQRQQQQKWALPEELGNSLEDIASCIRSLRLPLPEAIARQGDRPLCGVFFRKVQSLLRAEKPLSAAWQEAFSALEGQEGRTLQGISWSGDEAHLLEQLSFAADALKKQAEQSRRQGMTRQRVQLAAALCLALLAAIILL